MNDDDKLTMELAWQPAALEAARDALEAAAVVRNA